MKKKIKKSRYYVFILILWLTPPLHMNFFSHNESNSQISTRILLSTNPPNINLSKIPPIDYDSLYYEWYHPKIEMLIITPDNQSFINAVKPLMEWKNQKGIRTKILSNFTLYAGRDKAEKIRNMIKEYYNREKIQWVLLAGDATEDLIPTRYVYNPDTLEYGGSEHNGYNEYFKPTDYYYADLTDSWDEDGDGQWGESSMRTEYSLLQLIIHD